MELTGCGSLKNSEGGVFIIGFGTSVNLSGVNVSLSAVTVESFDVCNDADCCKGIEGADGWDGWDGWDGNGWDG